MNTNNQFCISEFVWIPNFSLNWQFWFFEPDLPKREILSETKNSEYNHWILHIRISLSTKFQFKQPILVFWPNLLKNSISGRKQKNHTCTCIMVVIYHLNFSVRGRTDTAAFWCLFYFWLQSKKRKGIKVSHIVRYVQNDYFTIHCFVHNFSMWDCAPI